MEYHIKYGEIAPGVSPYGAKCVLFNRAKNTVRRFGHLFCTDFEDFF